MREFKMPVSKSENGEYVSVGSVTVYYPVLSELGFNVEPKGFEVYKSDGTVEKVTADGSGLPQYDDDKAQYLFDAMFSAVKAKARNCLKPKSVELKDGLSIPSTLEELLATGERSGEAIKAYHEGIKAFAAFLPSTGKSKAVQLFCEQSYKNPESLQIMSQARKDLMLEMLKGFVTSLKEDNLARYAKQIQKVESNCTATALEDSDLPE